MICFWTVNFGTGADIDKQFAKLKEVRPDAPLMCSEFWSGWFDHWGRKHETRDGQIMVDGLKEMMDKGIFFQFVHDPRRNDLWLVGRCQ